MKLYGLIRLDSFAALRNIATNKGTQTAMDKTIDVDGASIRYRDSGGTGPTVLMTHGIAASLEFWQKQMDTADGSVRLIALDLPGHGLSGMGQQPYDPDSFSRFAWRFADALGLQDLTLSATRSAAGSRCAWPICNRNGFPGSCLLMQPRLAGSPICPSAS